MGQFCPYHIAVDAEVAYGEVQQLDEDKQLDGDVIKLIFRPLQKDE